MCKWKESRCLEIKPSSLSQTRRVAKSWEKNPPIPTGFQRSITRPPAYCSSHSRPRLPTLGRRGLNYQRTERRAEQQSRGLPRPSDYSNLCGKSQSLQDDFSLFQGKPWQQQFPKEDHNHLSDTNTASVLQDVLRHQHSSLQMIHQESAQMTLNFGTSSSTGKHLTSWPLRLQQVS